MKSSSHFESMNDEHLSRRMLADFRVKKSSFWESQREKNALALFHRAAYDVPAYKDFLKRNRINPAKIKTFADFQSVPPVSKKNYLRNYPLEKLVWGGTLRQPMVFTATSGSTGQPFYFPRGRELDWQSSILHEFFLENDSRQGSTLVIVGFGMGAWIGGLITYKAFEIANERGRRVAIITPGTNREEIFHALRELAPQFDQTIFTGYPPFVKDIIDEADNQGIQLKRLHMRILFAAESFSEDFRDYVAHKVGIKNVYRDTLNVYGTADIGTMAFETPTTILARRIALNNPGLFQSLFLDIEQTPTFAQYNPSFITFEATDGEILLSGNNTIPLVRYAIGDRGGVMSFADMERKINVEHVDFGKAAKKAGVGPITELPLVYVYERSDLSTKLYGAIIYPEHIKSPLLQAAVRNFLTGKFRMATRNTKKHQEYLELNIELKPHVKPSALLARKIERMITENLLKKNAEYHYLYGMVRKRVQPRIVFRNYADPAYFRPGVKQKWVEK